MNQVRGEGTINTLEECKRELESERVRECLADSDSEHVQRLKSLA